MRECNHAVAGSCVKCEPCGVCGRPKGDPHRYPVAGECTAPDSSDYTVSIQCLSIALRKAHNDVRAAEERGRRSGDSEWLTAITRWQEHPRCSVTMEQMFYDARHPEDTYLSERCDGCDPVRLLLTRALAALAPRASAPHGTYCTVDGCKRAYEPHGHAEPRDSGKEGK